MNIAGVGFIFGLIMGVLYGLVVMLWIVVGCIFVGVVYDYFLGMFFICNGGVLVLFIMGCYLGNGVKYFMNIFVIVLLFLVGVVFVLVFVGMIINLIN